MSSRPLVITESHPRRHAYAYVRATHEGAGPRADSTVLQGDLPAMLQAWGWPPGAHRAERRGSRRGRGDPRGSRGIRSQVGPESRRTDRQIGGGQLREGFASKCAEALAQDPHPAVREAVRGLFDLYLEVPQLLAHLARRVMLACGRKPTGSWTKGVNE